MEAQLGVQAGRAAAGDRTIVQAFGEQSARLRRFIRRRIFDPEEAEDILQDVFAEFVSATRLALPIETAGAWLFRVARNRMVDVARRRRTRAQAVVAPCPDGDGEAESIEDLLPSPEAGPEAAYARAVLIEELDEALGELPFAQREAFLAHEVEGLSFQELSARTGVAVGTLQSRKHSAVLHLRARLEEIHREFPAT